MANGRASNSSQEQWPRLSQYAEHDKALFGCKALPYDKSSDDCITVYRPNFKLKLGQIEVAFGGHVNIRLRAFFDAFAHKKGGLSRLFLKIYRFPRPKTDLAARNWVR